MRSSRRPAACEAAWWMTGKAAGGSSTTRATAAAQPSALRASLPPHREAPAPMTALEPATAPTLYFFGVTTTKSSIMKVFPAWAKRLGLDGAVIKGVDFPLHAPPESYRAAVAFLKSDPKSLGALVTTHKIDLYHAAHDLFDVVDARALLMGETSCLSKQDGKL